MRTLRRSSLRGAIFLVALALSSVGVAPSLRAESWRLRLAGPQAREALGHPAAARRRAAARVLGTHGDAEQAVDALVDALRVERDPSVRQALARALARRGDPDAVPVLVQALDAGDEADRTAMATALAALGTDPALRALVEALGHPASAPAAAIALRRAGAAAVVPLVRALRTDAIAEQVIPLLGELGVTSAVGALLPRTEHERPAVRAAALEALGRLGDDRAVRAVVARLDDEVEEVQVAALRALGRLGGPSEAPLLLRRVRAGPLALRRAALGALLRVDVGRARAPLAAALGAGGSLDRTARRLALDLPEPALLPLLEQLLSAGDTEAADALARVHGGRGLPALGKAAPVARDRALRDAIMRALAVGTRRWERAREADVASARATLEALLDPRDERAWVLGALARLPAAGDWARRGLRSAHAERRGAAAHALALLGDRRAGRWIVQAAVSENDPAAFASLAHAAVALRASVPLGPMIERLRRPDMAPDAMVLAARSLDDALPEQQRALRERLRQHLRAEDPRLRASAARALAEARDGSAWRALVERLDDPAPEVRLAVARALEALSLASAEPALRARWRVEDDPWVRRALSDAAEARQRRPLEAFGAQGLEVLRVRIASEEDGGRVTVDVILPDGRWLRLPSLATGELFLADLPAGTVDVRVRVA